MFVKVALEQKILDKDKTKSKIQILPGLFISRSALLNNADI